MLNMIVKDEAHCIERCIRSVLPYIDAAVIVDTGSTDDTLGIIESILPKRMCRWILHHEWKNFGYNRTEAIRAARLFTKRTGHAFIIDADEEFRPSPGFEMPASHLCRTAFAVWQTVLEGRYLRPQLLGLYHDWHFEGVVHEYATCKNMPQQYILTHCTTHGYFDSARNKQGQAAKLLADADLLKQQPRTPRNVFYIAESYRGAKDWKLAFYWYSIRLTMQGYDEERWWSALMIACCMDRVDDKPEYIVQAFKRAIDQRPTRPEAYVELAKYLHKVGRENEARKVFAESQKLPITTDSLNVDIRCYSKQLL